MLQYIHLQGFKGFKDTQVGPFKMVNLILGGQNVGKTSLLEAVYATAMLGPHAAGGLFRQNEGMDVNRFDQAYLNPQLFLGVLSTEGQGLVLAAKNRDTMFMPMPIAGGLGYREKSTLLKESIKAWHVGGFQNLWSCTAIPYFLPSQNRLVEIFGKVILGRKKKALITLLRAVDPRLESLDAIAPDGEHRVYAELDGLPQAVPLNLLGHGFSRLVYLFSELLVSESQLALIDEIENGIHYSALPTLFKGIKTVAQEGRVQSLITTHSWDAIRAACEVFEETPELFQVIRLERTGDNIQTVCIEGERMLRMMARDMEVR
ncbi:MAG: AAA family ATPase [Hydrogenophaga sp.]|uniref:AAA family ATPase n=1 Tax=Hydrogenophaga sp. TaxID=1904254 RepID=UPI00271E3E22|nr:AAA family ATPase [Hydrogenophaga sp.]MDO9569682.1 AAA family ATPase [Hydrogenophaga sp.]